MARERTWERRDVVTGLVGALTTGWVAGLRAASTPWAWCGGVTHDSAVITASGAPGRPIRLALRASGATVEERESAADQLGIATFPLRDLQPATVYAYRLTFDRGTLDGVFSTWKQGPFSFRLTFASCASTGSNSSVFDAIRATAPSLFFHMGDLHYENISENSVARFASAHRRVLTTPRQSALYRSAPVAYIWDDHDYGPNDSDRTSPSRAAACEAYRRMVPHYPLSATDGAIYQSFDMGRVRVIALDTRSGRDPRSVDTPRTMLGREQLAWLDRELSAAQSSALVLLVNSVPWITKVDESTDEGWAPYSEERTHIANRIERAGLTRRLMMLSGDAHQLALDDGTNSQYATVPGASTLGFPVIHAAPMDRFNTKKGGPYSHGELRQNGQFGVLDVEDSGAELRIRYQAHRKSGPAPNMGMTWTCGTDGLRRADILKRSAG